MVYLELATTAAAQGARPHSKPPFWTTLLDGLGAQVALKVGVVEEDDACDDVERDADVVAGAVEEVADEAREDTTVTEDEGSVDDVDERDLADEDTEELGS